MTISLRLSNEETLLFRKYAEINGITMSELFRQSVLDRIEDEYDLATYERAMAEYEKDPTTFSLAEVKEELGL